LTLAAAQSSFAVLPESSSVSEAVNDRLGAFHPVTVALPFALPPRPVHVSVKLDNSLVMLTDWLPELAREPAQSPPAVQPSAFVADHVSATGPPIRASVVAAEKVTIGAGGGPLPPPQLTSMPFAEATMIGSHLRT